ncbi:Hsp70 family protein [Pseudonocardia oroxyli]|uniref:40-residue YVTN family beta-propeller repeat-containing protein n=1 Tax=Pseudonocardia oroxyli TaxID=366584 RepID=A0A1G7P3Y1_PSEOR|nr:Hsp70 family protein [Pseudonocardia oroxyli]SDF81005.1 40-residue YVTN family beta-propeller repeat-containing protein [Pseudonocardia oroxyli]
MTYGLGVDLGTTFTAAAVRRGDRVERFRLGDRSDVAPSVVMIRQDGAVLTGSAAERRASVEPERVAREFKRKLGDPVPMIVGGSPMPVPALLAHLLRAVVGRVGAAEGAPPEQVTLTHPASWNTYQKEIFSQVPQLAEVGPVRMVTEPEAAAATYAANERLAAGATVAVYDLGGGTFDATVLRRTASGFEILGTPQGIQGLGGIDFDQAVFAHVRESLGEDALLGADRATLYRLRQECVHAKEALSVDTDVTVPVLLPSAHTHIRVTRGEFEDMVRPVLADTMTALRSALRSASVEAEDLTAVLLVGGSSKIPLVARMVSAEFKAPIAVDTDPEFAVALGAAALSAPVSAGPGPRAQVPTAPTSGATPVGAAAALGTGTGATARIVTPAVPAPTAAPTARPGHDRPAPAGPMRPGPGGRPDPARSDPSYRPALQPAGRANTPYPPASGQNGHGRAPDHEPNTRMFAPTPPTGGAPDRRFGAGDRPPELKRTEQRRWVKPVVIAVVVAAVVGGGAYAGVRFLGGGGGGTAAAPTTSETASPPTEAPLAFGAPVASVPIGKNPGRVAVTHDGGHAYTTNNGSNDVSVVDLGSNSVTATIPVGAGPVLVAVAPDDRHAYVTSITTGQLAVIDIASNTVAATVPVGKSPVGIAVSADGRTVYVANRDSNSLSVVDAATNTVTGTIRVPGGPFAVAVSGDGAHAYVTGAGNGSLAVVDLQRKAVVGTVEVGPNPGCVKIGADGTRAYVTSYDSASLKVVDVHDAANPTVAQSVTVGARPSYVALSPDGARAYVVNQGDGTVSVVDTGTNAVSRTFSVDAPAPNGMAVDPDGARGYVVSSDGNSLAVFSLEGE